MSHRATNKDRESREGKRVIVTVRERGMRKKEKGYKERGADGDRDSEMEGKMNPEWKYTYNIKTNCYNNINQQCV